MKKINFLVNNLGASQLGYFLTRNINEEYASNRHDIDYIVFYEIMHRYCLKPNFAIMSGCEIWGQEGITIATSSDLALKLTKTSGPERRILYLWDLDWIRGQQRNFYPVYAQLYTDPSLEIVCRSEDHSKLLQNSFNIKPIGIVEDFNLKQFRELLCI